MESKFIQCVNKAARRSVGHETYGDTTEFYDEDGAVVMTATQTGRNTVSFKFGNDESFNVQTDDSEDE